jgi:hypothetical protein
MSYSYSQLNEIIKLQYAKKASEDEYYNWFYEESIKLGKGVITTDEYLRIAAINYMKSREDNKDKIIGPALYEAPKN